MPDPTMNANIRHSVDHADFFTEDEMRNTREARELCVPAHRAMATWVAAGALAGRAASVDLCESVYGADFRVLAGLEADCVFGGKCQ